MRIVTPYFINLFFRLLQRIDGDGNMVSDMPYSCFLILVKLILFFTYVAEFIFLLFSFDLINLFSWF